VDTEYFHELLSGTSVHRQALIGLITPTLDRSFESLDPIEKAIFVYWLFRAGASYRRALSSRDQ
jgi:transcription termination factor NusB